MCARLLTGCATSVLCVPLCLRHSHCLAGAPSLFFSLIVTVCVVAACMVNGRLLGMST